MRTVFVFLTTPSNALVLLIVLGLGLMLLRWRRLGMSAALLGTVGLLTFGYSSAGELLMAPLVSRFAPPDLETVSAPFGIIVTGDGVNEVSSRTTGALMELTEAGDSVPISALLALRYPNAQLILIGGSGHPRPTRPADGMRRILMEFGVDEDRITIDADSLSTHERVTNAMGVIGADRDKTWWLVTSAHRMPRAIGVFRAQGLEPIPYPVDFRWIPPFDPLYTYPLTEGLAMTDTAAKEWLGMLLYRMQGKTQTYFPAP
ncbi:YdcF family protein [uncultured Tateyamaria sp.]|uniref:YdcF family protein n=1 Tax=uncultured Tateyamaria sp. TaxID=455651 RepID=UPI002627BD87|nr:YdcF family protein [uncultured Tateyamaria sp.]